MTASLWESGEDGATPLSPESAADLTTQYKHITLRSELDEAEAANIARAVVWAYDRKRTLVTLLEASFICTLHKRMFGDVWTWAGIYRKYEVNIGNAHHYEIPTALRQLTDDAKYWFSQGTYSDDEAAVRLHHRLVLIHPFPNGNGRLSRFMANLVAVTRGHTRFGWGDSLGDRARPRYIAALHAADGQDLKPLLDFARTP
jgi:Fic-DOC domain mobile mystery protein B